MADIETQYNLFTSAGERVAEIKSDPGGLDMVRLEIFQYCGHGYFHLSPDDAIAVANAILRKAKDIKESNA